MVDLAEEQSSEMWRVVNIPVVAHAENKVKLAVKRAKNPGMKLRR